MGKLPKDCNAREIGSTAVGIVHYKFPKKNWEFRQITGVDTGVDCICELIENEEYHNKKIEGQIKGTKKPKLLENKEYFSFPMEIKTIRHGLGSSNAFILFYVDIEEELVYYLPMQDYFISNPSFFEKLEKDQQTLNVHIPANNIISDNDDKLIEIAKSVYVGGPSYKLRKAQ